MKNEFISVFWAWNGDLNKEVIQNQLTDFKDKGITDVFAHARAGLKVEYMGKEWLDAFAYALEVAERLGLKVWIYDENGWPSGFGGGKVYQKDESFKQRYLMKERLTAAEFLRKAKAETIVGVYDFADGVLHKIPTEQALVEEIEHEYVYIVTNDFYVDITNPEVVDYFLETTHEVYKARFSSYFGNVIPGVFTDEPHIYPHGMPYGKYIKSEYEKEYEESFLTAVENVFFEIDGYESYRYKFRKLITRLITDNYAKKYNAWCETNGLKLTGHYANEEGLLGQVKAIGSAMPLYPHMGLTGIDALGNRLIPAVAYKQAKSVSKQFGDGLLISETYAGTGYDSSFKELLRIWAYQAICGVTHLCASISMMSLEGNRKRDYPQFFSEQMPWWEKSNELFSRIKFINSNVGSEYLTDVLVVHSMSGLYCYYGNETDDKVLSLTTSFRNLTESLLDAQVDFDYGEEGIIAERAIVENGAFRIGKVDYKTVIVAENPNIESGVLAKIKAFALSGGRVIFVGELPKFTDGKRVKPRLDFPFDIMANRADYVRKYVQAYFMPKVCVMDRLERKINPQFAVSLLKEGEEYRFTVLNKRRSERAIGRIVVQGKKQMKALSIEGERTICGVYDDIRDVSEFNIDLDGLEYAIYAITDGIPLRNDMIKTAETYLSPDSVHSSFNTFTIDYARISIDDNEYDEEEYVLNKTAKLFAAINGKGETKVKIKYAFTVKDRVERLYAIAEIGAGEAYINGVLLTERLTAFYKDAAKFDISNYVKVGENELVIQLRMPPYENELLGKELFQSVLNVFSFPYYVEAVYLEGAFRVACETNSLATHVIAQKPFSLTAQREIGGGDLTVQGMPFFSGKAEAEYTLTIDKGADAIALSVGESHACYAEIEINGKRYAAIDGRDIDITDGIKGKKEVKVKLTLYSSIRNLFGPLHHTYGKHYYTGPSVFEGYAEWQDGVIYPELSGNTFVEEYAFVHFILPNVTVKRYKKR